MASQAFAIQAAVAGGAAFAAALALTPWIAAVARRAGAVAKPKTDRWHSRPTAMFGGVAIAAAVLGAMLLLLPLTREGTIVVAASSALFLVGLADDFLQVKPYQKLIGQLLAAAAVISLGLILPWTGSFVVNVLITVFWIVGITNAVNMLDNMDGLAAGVCAVAAAFLALTFYTGDQLPQALMLIAFAAALLGFLVYNHHPASIFMGDCGSMFIGFFLASSALAASGGGGRSRSIAAVLGVPVLVLVVPIFDTTLVTLLRKAAGRPASQGGRDHTSHRLVALGLSEKHAVWMLYAFAFAGGALAMLVRHAALDVSVGAIAAFIVALTYLGVYLARVRVYDQDDAAPRPAVFTFLLNVSYKRRLFEVALDVVLIVLAYYFAHALVLGPAAQTSDWRVFLQTLPIVLALKLALLLAAGVYRGLWRYTGLHDLGRYARGVALGSAATVLCAGVVGGFAQLRPSVFVIDALLLLLAIAGSRFGFRLLRKVVPLQRRGGGRRVVIYGAGDGGELLFRELRNNAELQRVPVAFLDDDPGKAGRMLHGLAIAAPNGPGSVAALCRALGAEELVVSTARVPPGRLRAIVDECERAGVAVQRMIIDIQALTQETLARA
jgi:UDP-GlcNAc:undecaprenyl-phosphate GlcNAc-1-phosphate transferase